MAKGSVRNVGRPRARNNGPQGPAREAILLAAAQLFTKQGYAGTSTREIAERVGIRQPSLFYHFNKKEEILRAIVNESATEVFDFLRTSEKTSGRAAVKLYELMLFDFHWLMTEPFRVGQLMMLPELRGGVFRKEIDKKRNKIIGAYRKLIKQGIEDGDFLSGDLNITTNTVFGMGEAIWAWYRPTRAKTPRNIAGQIADIAIRALLRDSSDLDSIKKAASSRA